MGRPRANYIGLEAGIHDDEKIYNLVSDLDRIAVNKRKTNVDEVVGKLSRLWIWLLVHRQSSSVEGLSDEQITGICRFDYPPEKLVAILKSNRVLVCKRTKFYAAGWDRINGSRLKELARKTRYYESKRDSIRRRTVDDNPSVPSDTRSENRRSENKKKIEEEEKKTSKEESGLLDLGLDPPEPERKKPKRRKSEVPSGAARKLVERFELVSGYRSTDAVPRSVQRILDAGKGSELLAAVDSYEADVVRKDTPREYRIRPHNFFGRAARWQEFRILQPTTEIPPTEIPEDDDDPGIVLAKRVRCFVQESNPKKKLFTDDAVEWRACVAVAFDAIAGKIKNVVNESDFSENDVAKIYNELLKRKEKRT